MSKITLVDVTNLVNQQSAVDTLKNNNDAIEAAFDNTFSLDGTAPNSLNTDLDMNSNQILNLPAAVDDTEPVRKGEFDAAIEGLTGNNIALPNSGLVSYNATTGLAVARTFTATSGSGITITNADGVAGNPNFNFDSSIVSFTPALDAIKNLTPAADKLAYYTGTSSGALTSLTSYGRSLIGSADAPTARTTLGLVIGTNVQAFDAELSALAGLTSGADLVPYFTGSGTAATASFTSFGRSLAADSSASAARTTLGLVIGTDVQAHTTNLDTLTGLTSTTKGNLIVGTTGGWTTTAVGTDTWVLTADSTQTGGVKWAAAPGAGGGLSNAYTAITDGTTTASASGSATARFKAGTGLTVAVDTSGGNNVTYTPNSALQSLSANTAPSGTLVGTTDTQTLTNKTLTAPTFSTITNSGTLTLPSGADTLAAIAATQTLTNKRVTPRRNTTTSSATPAINTDTTDIFSVTALTTNITSMTSSLSGTPVHGDKLIIEITGTAARTITWGTSYEASTVALPTTTVTTAMLTTGFMWNSTTSKWRCLAVA